jgi:hypothetical protein
MKKNPVDGEQIWKARGLRRRNVTGNNGIVSLQANIADLM